MSCEAGKVLVLGLGDELSGDEGLGMHVARSLLAERGSLPAQVDVLPAGASLLDFVPEMSRYSRVIIVDAVRNGQTPGSLYRAETLAELARHLETLPPISLHEWSLIETLRAAEGLGMLPAQLTLIGAEPESIAPSTELTPMVARAAQEIVSMLLEELRNAGASSAGAS